MSGEKSLPTLVANRSMAETLHYANVGSETLWRTRRAPSLTPPRTVQQMRFDLWTLPLWSTLPSDRALAPDAFPLTAPTLHPKWQERSLSLAQAHALLSASEARLHLWAWEHIPTLREYLPSALFCANNETAVEWAMNRKFSLLFAQKYLSSPHEEIGVFLVESEEELLRLRSLYPRLMVKHPYSSSGRGVALLQNNDSSLFALQSLLKYGFVMIERWVEKKNDYAAEYFIDDSEEVAFRGISCFETDPHGRYSGNLMQGREYAYEHLAQEVGEETLRSTIRDHIRCLQSELAPYYSGWVGIDMLSFREASSGKTALHPFVEINLRYTMGAYALDLYDRVCPPGSTARMRIVPLSESIVSTYKHALTEAPLAPLPYGHHLLTPVRAESRYGALLDVEK